MRWKALVKVSTRVPQKKQQKERNTQNRKPTRLIPQPKKNAFKVIPNKKSHPFGFAQSLHGFKLHGFEEVPLSLIPTDSPHRWKKNIQPLCLAYHHMAALFPLGNFPILGGSMGVFFGIPYIFKSGSVYWLPLHSAILIHFLEATNEFTQENCQNFDIWSHQGIHTMPAQSLFETNSGPHSKVVFDLGGISLKNSRIDPCRFWSHLLHPNIFTRYLGFYLTLMTSPPFSKTNSNAFP